MKRLASERAQAVAADLLFLGLLVSISSVMLFVFGIGARQADTHATALQQRYVAELVQVGYPATDVVQGVAQDCRQRSDHFHRVGEAELAKAGDLAADVVDGQAQDCRT